MELRIDMTDEVEVVEKKAKLVNPEFVEEVIKAGAVSVNLCWQCGTCTASCPSGLHTAFRVRKLIRRVQLGFMDEVLPADDMWMCTTCYTCHERCPRDVKIPEIIFTLRNMAVKMGYMAETHKKAATLLVKTGHTIPLDDKAKALRKKVGLIETPLTTLSNSEALEEVQKILRHTGFDKIVGA
ncbi:MAG: CoB--CoM heterodisulfide reductase subunit C [Thermoplasmata archaeon]|nr:MAG: CoB--CoM heterodisulfide reductase subunit C [Thermoplasmata archaeon]